MDYRKPKIERNLGDYERTRRKSLFGPNQLARSEEAERIPGAPVQLKLPLTSSEAPSPEAPNSEAPDVLTEAKQLVDVDRRADYGPDVAVQHEICARLWSTVLGIHIKSKTVALCMMLLKISREVLKHKRDNIVDICGYAKIYELLVKDSIRENLRNVNKSNQIIRDACPDLRHYESADLENIHGRETV